MGESKKNKSILVAMNKEDAYKKFVNGKELNPNNGDLFEELLKKAATTKIEKKPKKK